jgi:hypothetical protein
MSAGRAKQLAQWNYHDQAKQGKNDLERAYKEDHFEIKKHYLQKEL